jgi:hypothetical protein
MNRYVDVTYCDDIREEFGGKQSYIGVYRHKLIVPEIPTTLPKLCVLIQATTPAANPFKTLTVRVLKDDEILVESTQENLGTGQARLRDPSVDLEHATISATFPVVLAPLTIERVMSLRVRVIADGEELRGQGLAIELRRRLF